NHIDIYVDPNSPPGDWSVRLETPGVAPVAFDAWIELEDDKENSPDQSVFAKDADANGTLSALACGARTVVVGAFSSSPLGDTTPVASFSSSGPTRASEPTGIRAKKPDLSAPGQFDETRGVEAACATTQGVTRFAGTSQAAPHVAGVIALMMQAASRKLTVEEIWTILTSTASPAPLQT